ncbi:hypothetical protein ACP4OV_014652 [Aristida adscensionis]
MESPRRRRRRRRRRRHGLVQPSETYMRLILIPTGTHAHENGKPRD